MALTGAIELGYVAAHMLGNLQVFEGAGKINAYAGNKDPKLRRRGVAARLILEEHCAFGVRKKWQGELIRTRFLCCL